MPGLPIAFDRQSQATIIEYAVRVGGGIMGRSVVFAIALAVATWLVCGLPAIAGDAAIEGLEGDAVPKTRDVSKLSVAAPAESSQRLRCTLVRHRS